MYNIHVNRSQVGFTIVELLIVIVVIAILAAITIVSYNGVQGRAATASLQSGLRQTANLLSQNRTLDGTYPASQAEFASVIDIRTSNTLLYAYDAPESTYCVTARSERTGVSDYYISPETGAPTEGACALHGGTDDNPLIPQAISTTSAAGERGGEEFEVPLPANATGYLAIALDHQGTEPPSAPSGWDYYGTNDDIALWTSTSTRSPGPGTTWVSSTHDSPIVILGFSRPVSVAQHAPFAHGNVSPSITTTGPSLVLRSVTANYRTISSPPAKHVESFNGSSFILGVTYEAQETPGSTGTFDWGEPSSETWSNTTEIVVAR